MWMLQMAFCFSSINLLTLLKHVLWYANALFGSRAHVGTRVHVTLDILCRNFRVRAHDHCILSGVGGTLLKFLYLNRLMRTRSMSMWYYSCLETYNVCVHANLGRMGVGFHGQCGHTTKKVTSMELHVHVSSENCQPISLEKYGIV